MIVILCSENIECVAAPQYRILALARQGALILKPSVGPALEKTLNKWIELLI